MMSAFLFYQNISCLRDIFTKFKSRFKSLVIPYLLWNLLMTSIFFFASQATIVRDMMNQEAGINSIFDFLKSVILHKYTILWFVFYLIIFTYSAPVFYWSLKSKIVSHLLCIVLIIGAFIYGNDSRPVFWGSFYYFGAVVGYHYKETVIRRIDFTLTSKILLLVLWFIVFYICSTFHYEYAYRFMSPIFLWLLYDAYGKNLGTEWMTCSFFIYCTHYYIVYPIKPLIYHFSPMLMQGNFAYITFILIGTTTLISITIIANLIKGNEIYKVMTGYR